MLAPSSYATDRLKKKVWQLLEGPGFFSERISVDVVKITLHWQKYVVKNAEFLSLCTLHWNLIKQFRGVQERGY